MPRITKQQHEIQLQQIFRMLLESKTQEEIAHQLNVNVRTVQRYTLEIDKRYGEIQSQKTDNTIFTEIQIFKNRMLRLYKILEKKSEDPKTSGAETAKLCEVAANIAIDVIKAESEGVKVVKELLLAKKNSSPLNNLRSFSNNHNKDESNNYDTRDEFTRLDIDDDNRKF
jgi:hypothetical protein